MINGPQEKNSKKGLVRLECSPYDMATYAVA